MLHRRPIHFAEHVAPLVFLLSHTHQMRHNLRGIALLLPDDHGLFFFRGTVPPESQSAVGKSFPGRRLTRQAAGASAVLAGFGAQP